ncbi:Uncharacterized protein DAT39_020760 [Clarias magur]|uniref:Uncharacterized protein n=1 Tax=Clarias magur TaxID=1594786 RepID=A0A8J4T5A6_CLAMG|nr:Uncharacterized protein DAT39_020760 [Clarias magur]
MKTELENKSRKTKIEVCACFYNRTRFRQRITERTASPRGKELSVREALLQYGKITKNEIMGLKGEQ